MAPTQIDGPIAFGSRFAPTYTGGLAVYQRCLAGALIRHGFSGYSLCEHERFPHAEPEFDPPPWPLHLLKKRRPFSRITKSLLPRLAGRPAFIPLCGFLAAHRLQVPAMAAPAVVHVTGTGWDFTGFALERWAQKYGVPVTIWPAVHIGQWGDDKLDVQFYRRADKVFCQSRHEIEHLVGLGLPEEKTVLCGLPPFCAADGNGARLRGKLGLGQRPIVFFLGRRDRGKGFPAVIAAWQTVLERHPDAVLLLAGPKSSAPVPDLPADSFRDLGLVGERDKVDAYAACEVFCLPSAHESFGIVYVEAWSYGKPVICGTAPASRELVEDGRTGLWADQNPAALAEKLVFLLSNPAEAQRLGAAGLALQQTMFTGEKMLEVHLQAWGLSSYSNRESDHE